MSRNLSFNETLKTLVHKVTRYYPIHFCHSLDKQRHNKNELVVGRSYWSCKGKFLDQILIITFQVFFHPFSVEYCFRRYNFIKFYRFNQNLTRLSNLTFRNTNDDRKDANIMMARTPSTRAWRSSSESPA